MHPSDVTRPVAGYFASVTATELSSHLQRGTLESREVVQRCLDEIERLNPLINAFVHVDAEGACRAAAASDRRRAEGHALGPLDGLPVAVKDNIDTFDMPTTYGSAHFAGHRPLRDAACVSSLRAAGAIIVGKTLTHEFAYGPTGDRSLQGAARNPHDMSRMTGGSSAGSAAAIAAGMVPLALGTDTGGSVRIPSALCGTVGFKPSFNTVPMDGVFPLSSSLDHLGTMARTVADAALIFRALSPGAETVDGPTGRPRVAWIDGSDLGPVDPAVRACVRRHAEEWLAGKVESFDAVEDVQPLSRRLLACVAALQRSEAYAVHAARMRAAPELFDAEVRSRLEVSAQVAGWEYVQGLHEQRLLREAMATFFTRYDLLVMPTTPITAPRVGERDIIVDGTRTDARAALLSLTSPWNATGLPALSVPAGCVAGLPVGLQIVAPFARDAWLLRLFESVG
ncbi:amidase [Cupriavidus pauculus]|uniref:Amidase n=1 Tax=Cupriavidus pauculus TaxID=82633 RepID=A0A5P2H2V2_9BURK|nr:amidase [Cupriavidus pauculus]QET01650.1 amidase [Cupriavidus pauculus]